MQTIQACVDETKKDAKTESGSATGLAMDEEQDRVWQRDESVDRGRDKLSARTRIKADIKTAFLRVSLAESETKYTTMRFCFVDKVYSRDGMRKSAFQLLY